MPQTTPQWRAEASEAELRNRAAEMRSEWAELSQTDRNSDDYSKARAEFLAEVDDIDTNLTLRQMATQAVRRAPHGALNDVHGDEEFRSPGQIVTENEGFRSWMEQNRGQDQLIGPSPRVELRDLVTLGSSSNLLLPVQQPSLVGVDRRRLFLRNLFSTTQVTQAAVPYVRELNAATNETAATTVPEGGTKPEAKIEFEPALAPVAVIAVNIPITTQMLEDGTFIRGYIDTRLRYMLQVEEEEQLLNGDGTGANLTGLDNVTGTLTQAAVAGETAQTLGNAIMQIETKNGYADGVVMNPADAWAMWMNRAAGGSGTFDAGTPFANIPQNVWGLSVVRTNAVAAGTAWVGAFQLGATVLDRRQAYVRVYEQHADFPVKNKVLIQAEERVGLMVFRPDWFVKATVA